MYKNIDILIHIVYYQIMDIEYNHPRKLLSSEIVLNPNKFLKELSDAQYSLGLLEGSQRKLQDSKLLISPLTAKEATISSKIEGTQSTVADVFLFDTGAIPRFPDIRQVINYRSAMDYSINELKKGRSLTPHLVKTLHGILLKDVRHQGKLGQFRDDKVWIAEKAGDPIEKAIYIPPQHYLVEEYIEDLFAFIDKGHENALVKAGIAHYQFEAIHPFTDGNGRIGRLLIPLILYCKNKISQPILYISGYFEEHRDEYMQALHDVDKTGDYDQWLAFYFRSVSEQLRETQKLVDSIYSLYDTTKEQFGKVKSPFIIPFLDFIFKKPYFTVPMIVEEVKVSTRTTALNLIKLFEERNLVTQTRSKHQRAKIYAFRPLLNLLK